MPGSTWRAVGALGSVGLSFVLAIVIGVAIGQWVDRRLDSAPWGFLVFFAFGLAAGILNVYRTTSRLMK
jgi:ATP synthase protein I